MMGGWQRFFQSTPCARHLDARARYLEVHERVCGHARVGIDAGFLDDREDGEGIGIEEVARDRVGAVRTKGLHGLALVVGAVALGDGERRRLENRC
jgi:hypothetical protein